MSDAAQPPPESRLGPFARWVVGVAVMALSVGSIYGLLALLGGPAAREPPPQIDPNLSAPSPYLNVTPDVQYVGDDVCARCHRSQAETYRRHPMGRSLAPVGDAADHSEHTRQAGSPFDALGMQFRVERRGNQIIHAEVAYDANRRAVAQTEAAISYVIGSGTHAFSYLIQHDGMLTQSPITWFARKKSWDLSPGFGIDSDHFERAIVPGCLFCHTNRVDAEPGSLNSYRQPIFRGYAIGCERCHGPGALHAQARENFREVADPDVTIVNPGRLSLTLRDSVCEQCHLGGPERVVRRGRGVFDYRPGLPLEEFLRVFVSPKNAGPGTRVAGHVEQLHFSKCFQKSAGRLGCISCHDPHVLPKPEDKATYYRDRCLQCHSEDVAEVARLRGQADPELWRVPLQPCTVPLARRHETTRTDDCTVCHMTSADSDINHVALTDHRILRQPDSRGRTTAAPAALTAARFLVPFGRDTVDLNDAELARDWAVALIGRARSQPEAFREESSRLCLPILERAVRDHPDDLEARESLGVALAWQGQREQAFAVYEATLKRAPRREYVLIDAAIVTQKMGLYDLSLGYWQRALAVNPWSSRYRFEVAQTLGQLGDVDKGVAECQRLLARNGTYAAGRYLMLRHYLNTGLRPQARVEWEALLALHPPNEAELRKTYGELFR